MGRQKPRRMESNKGLTILVCILAVVCLIAGGIYIDTFYGSGKFMTFVTQTTRTETDTKLETARSAESMAVDAGSKAAIAVFGKEFLLCTKDGVKYYTSMGDQKWNDTFNMTAPTMIQEGGYVAVGDLSGKSVRVYDQSGLLYDLQAEGTPIQFALNESGYLSLITKQDDAYRVRIYNTKGTLLKGRVEESTGIYPLSSDVSDDGRVFAVSYLDTTDISPIARVVLFYIDATESEEYTDSMFAAVEKPGELIPVISYMKGGVLAAVSDKGIYGIGAEGQEVWSYALENTIDQASFSMKEYVVLALGDSVADKDGREKGTVCWLDANGKEKASYESGESVTYLSAGERGVVIGNDRKYTGLTHGGNVSWNDTATADMSDLIPMEKLNRVMTVGKETVSIMEMTKEEKTQQAVEKAAESPEEPENDEAQTEGEESPQVDPSGQEQPEDEAAQGEAGGNGETE